MMKVDLTHAAFRDVFPIGVRQKDMQETGHLGATLCSTVSVVMG